MIENLNKRSKGYYTLDADVEKVFRLTSPTPDGHFYAFIGSFHYNFQLPLPPLERSHSDNSSSEYGKTEELIY